jgi:DinB superfamily
VATARLALHAHDPKKYSFREDLSMNGWGSTAYGNPCRECDFTWTTSVADGVSLVTGMPRSLSELLAGRSGSERSPELAWSASSYVCHIGDNLRIWAERLIGVVEGASPLVGSYDEQALSEARNYATVPLAAALWSLARSADDWLTAVERSGGRDVVLVHPDRGVLDLADVVVANAHDAHHHRWDIGRILGAYG